MKSEYLTYIYVSIAVVILFLSMLVTPISDTGNTSVQTCPVGQTMAEDETCVPLSFYNN
jgi:hypothetical protein